MKKIRALIALLSVTIFLCGATYLILLPLEREIRTSRQILALNNIDLSKEGTISWDIPTKNWQYNQGEARLALALNTIDSIPPHLRDGEKLRLKISATGTLPNGTVNNRLIQDWYYTTDEPFTNNPKLWESGDADITEYGLAGIDVHPYERLTIQVRVLSPYPEIQSASPRLKLAPAHDYAIDEHFPTLRCIAWGACGIGVCATFILFLQAWRKSP
jgi:hypothetical protein